MNDAAAVETLLKAFFGEGNDVSPGQLPARAPELAAWLDRRIERLRQDPMATHVLPRTTSGRTTWYGLAHSQRQLRDLTQALEAFVVPTYGRLRSPAPLMPVDPVEAAVIGFTGGHALLLSVLPGEHERVRRAFDLLADLEAQRPLRRLSLSRPLGRLLRDFEMAVLASSEEASDELLHAIEETGHLSTQNIVFLRIRRLAGLHRYAELLRLPQLATILALRKPAKVSASILEAIYATELAHYESDDDPIGALQHFQEFVVQRYSAALKSRHGLQTPTAIKMFMLQTLALHPDDVATREQLLAAPDLNPQDQRFLHSLASIPGLAIRGPGALADAIAAVRAGDFDLALDIARNQPASVESAEVLIRCAFEIDSIEAMRVAASTVKELAAEHQEALLTSKWYGPLLAQITRTLSGEPAVPAVSVATSWPEWFRRAVQDDDFINALQIAERGVVEWSAEAFDSDDARVVAQTITHNMSPQSMRLVKDGLPHFLQFLDRQEAPQRHRQLLDDIAVLLLLDPELCAADVQVIHDLAGTLLESGVSADRYRQLVADLRELWERVNSPAHLDTGLEMLDLLLTYACPDREARDTFFQALVAAFQQWRRRVRPDQWALLTDLAAELGSADFVTALQPTDDAATGFLATTRASFAGKTVAIYTLTEPAAARARDFVLRHFSGARVELCNDHVASPRLRSLARAADVFIVATKSAKHSATEFIESQRPPGRPVLYAAGKGSASLIRTLFAYAAR